MQALYVILLSFKFHQFSTLNTFEKGMSTISKIYHGTKNTKNFPITILPAINKSSLHLIIIILNRS